MEKDAVQTIMLDDFEHLLKENWTHEQYSEITEPNYEYNGKNREVGWVSTVAELKGLSITYTQQYSFDKQSGADFMFFTPDNGEPEFDFDFKVKDGDTVLSHEDVAALVKQAGQFTQIDEELILGSREQEMTM